jgi:hypothetical protein
MDFKIVPICVLAATFGCGEGHGVDPGPPRKRSIVASSEDRNRLFDSAMWMSEATAALADPDSEEVYRVLEADPAGLLGSLDDPVIGSLKSELLRALFALHWFVIPRPARSRSFRVPVPDLGLVAEGLLHFPNDRKLRRAYLEATRKEYSPTERLYSMSPKMAQKMHREFKLFGLE